MVDTIRTEISQALNNLNALTGKEYTIKYVDGGAQLSLNGNDITGIICPRTMNEHLIFAYDLIKTNNNIKV
jgi:hypothetical protein